MYFLGRALSVQHSSKTYTKGQVTFDSIESVADIRRSRLRIRVEMGVVDTRLVGKEDSRAVFVCRLVKIRRPWTVDALDAGQSFHRIACWGE